MLLRRCAGAGRVTLHQAPLVRGLALRTLHTRLSPPLLHLQFSRGFCSETPRNDQDKKDEKKKEPKEEKGLTPHDGDDTLWMIMKASGAALVALLSVRMLVMGAGRAVLVAGPMGVGAAASGALYFLTQRLGMPTILAFLIVASPALATVVYILQRDDSFEQGQRVLEDALDVLEQEIGTRPTSVNFKNIAFDATDRELAIVVAKVENVRLRDFVRRGTMTVHARRGESGKFNIEDIRFSWTGGDEVLFQGSLQMPVE